MTEFFTTEVHFDFERREGRRGNLWRSPRAEGLLTVMIPVTVVIYRVGDSAVHPSRHLLTVRTRFSDRHS